MIDLNKIWKISLQTENGSAFMEEKGGEYVRGDARVFLLHTQSGLKIAVTAENTPVCAVSLYWRTDLPAEALIMGDHWERGYGDLEFRGYTERELPWYFLYVTGGQAQGVGVMTGPNAICSFRLSRDVLVMRLDVRNGGSGVMLGGRKLFAAELVTAESEGESVYRFGRRFCGMLCGKPVMPAQPLYGGNNWYYAYGESSDAEIREDGKFIAELSGASGNRPFMCIDDGWQVSRNFDYCGGPWHTGNRKFPDMARLAEDMKKDGVRPGLWIRPLLNAAGLPKAYRLPRGRFLSNELGGEYNWFLDPTVPEALELVKEDIGRVAGWGFELIKHDYTTYDLFGRWGKDMGWKITNDGWHFADRSRTNMEIVLELYRAIAEAAGSAYVLGCNTIGHAAAGVFAANRTGDDTSGLVWERTRDMGVNTMAFRLMQHGTFYAADADCVGATKNIPWELNRQWLDLVAKSGTPLFVSADPRETSPEQKRDIAAAFALAAQEREAGEPLDWLHNITPNEFLLDGEITRYNWDLL
ncbi:MAG: alpha-galactosidase [Defluviitaleaceae bacterium]|nr:alpha-galactosidase [Defluviitaleaceae bacterium]